MIVACYGKVTTSYIPVCKAFIALSVAFRRRHHAYYHPGIYQVAGTCDTARAMRGAMRSTAIGASLKLVTAKGGYYSSGGARTGGRRLRWLSRLQLRVNLGDRRNCWFPFVVPLLRIMGVPLGQHSQMRIVWSRLV